MSFQISDFVYIECINHHKGGGVRGRRQLQTMLGKIVKRIAKETLRMVTLIR